MATVAVAGSGGSVASNATTGQHGQDCPPGFHDAADGSCVRNGGGGGGNCGDNQSGNDDGLGNGGNDNGFGNGGDKTDTCEASTTTTTSGKTTTTAAGTTTATPTTTGSNSGPFTPPSITCAVRLGVGRTHFVVGRRSKLVVRVRGAEGRPLAGVTVLVRGAGVNLRASTDAAGVARFFVRPRSPGVIRINLLQPDSCASVSRLARANAPFEPPKPNYTG